jgi:hypothetical protein
MARNMKLRVACLFAMATACGPAPAATEDGAEQEDGGRSEEAASDTVTDETGGDDGDVQEDAGDEVPGVEVVPPEECIPTSTAETCNGKDDNCDGRIDEGLFGPLGDPVLLPAESREAAGALSDRVLFPVAAEDAARGTIRSYSLYTVDLLPTGTVEVPYSCNGVVGGCGGVSPCVMVSGGPHLLPIVSGDGGIGLFWKQRCADDGSWPAVETDAGRWWLRPVTSSGPGEAVQLTERDGTRLANGRSDYTEIRGDVLSTAGRILYFEETRTPCCCEGDVCWEDTVTCVGKLKAVDPTGGALGEWEIPFACMSSLAAASDGERVVVATTLPAWERGAEYPEAVSTDGPWFVRIWWTEGSAPSVPTGEWIDVPSSVFGFPASEEHGYLILQGATYSGNNLLLRLGFLAPDSPPPGTPGCCRYETWLLDTIVPPPSGTRHVSVRQVVEPGQEVSLDPAGRSETIVQGSGASLLIAGTWNPAELVPCDGLPGMVGGPTYAQFHRFLDGSSVVAATRPTFTLPSAPGRSMGELRAVPLPDGRFVLVYSDWLQCPVVSPTGEPDLDFEEHAVLLGCSP